MDDQGLIAKLLDGQSLRTRMVPDPAIPTNNPEHVETYDLPHVIINGDLFWAKSATAHLSVDGDRPIGNVAFCYTNSAEVFVSYGPEISGRPYVMRLSRYREHDWMLKEDYRLIWDSESGQPAEAVGVEIDAAARFKVAMLDAEDVWNVHPVDLPMYYPDSGTFEMKTAADWYILQMRTPADLARQLSAAGGDAESDDRESIMTFDAQKFSTYYNLRSDGTYQNYYDLARRTRQEYKALRVYSDTPGDGA